MQLRRLRAVLSSDARPIQPLNGRTVRLYSVISSQSVHSDAPWTSTPTSLALDAALNSQPEFGVGAGEEQYSGLRAEVIKVRWLFLVLFFGTLALSLFLIFRTKLCASLVEGVLSGVCGGLFYTRARAHGYRVSRL